MPIRAGFRVIGPEYLATVGIPVLHGRAFHTSDRANSQPVAIVNETMARRVWGGSHAVARKIRIKENSNWMIVVGVVPDVKQLGLTAHEGPVVYIPYSQNFQSWMSWTTVVVRTAAKPENLLPSLRKAIHTADKDLPLEEVGTLEQVLSRSTAIPRFVAAAAGLLSAFSLLIAVLGIYGLLAYTVELRIPELGIRLALGASRLQVLALLLRGTIIRVLVALVCGLLVAWWVAKLITS